MTRAQLFMPRSLVRALIAATLFAPLVPASAHEGHDHGAASRPADIELAPRFEVRSEELELVGVLSNKKLVIYLDGAADNAPIPGAQLEVEGQGIKGRASEIGDGVYQIAAAPPGPGKYPLTITVQAGEMSDLLSAELEIAPVTAADSAPRPDRTSWYLGAMALAILSGAAFALRRRRQSFLRSRAE